MATNRQEKQPKDQRVRITAYPLETIAKQIGEESTQLGISISKHITTIIESHYNNG